MSKFNVRRILRASGPIVTDATPSGTTHEGAPGYARDAKSELFLLAVANLVGEDTFYERAGQRDDRYENLIREVAVADAGWTLAFLTWLRAEGNLRSASLVGAAEAVAARLDAAKTSRVGTSGSPGPAGGVRNRQFVDAVLQRADEPGELLAYWTARHGRAIPKPVKRGVSDAIGRLYTEWNLLKYDTDAKGFRFADVIDLTHPSPAADKPWQGRLFEVALLRRHGRDWLSSAAGLPTLVANARFRDRLRTDPDVIYDAAELRRAGMTWEDALSLGGSGADKARLWSAIIPSMGLMALARNLRNFDQAGVPDEVAERVMARFRDPGQVARSRMFPFRWLAAARHAPSLRWGHALDQALTASLSHVPELTGRTLILVDRSGSMFGRVSRRSELTNADAAAIFGAALAMRNHGRTDLVQFGTGSAVVDVRAGESLLRVLERFANLGGTQTLQAVRRHYAKHDRVVIVTDEQAWRGSGDPGSVIPAEVPLYTWNLAGYQHGHGPGLPNRHTFGGLTDAAFRLIPLLEANRNGDWPWNRG
ncbi:TROVE domain-containing protein [Rugosimonospora acidiphila]|uniref:TROVE domain-containing protein n=1 Tax=Rugosimonospora acidiphila TaxID=556531 RepID=A0ABP9RQB6_9ACTN